MGKKKKLMDIGRPRHDEFETQLRRRFKDRADVKPIVNKIEEQGIDAEVQMKKGKQTVEAYELTNYDLFHFPNINAIKALKQKLPAQTKLSSFKTATTTKHRTLCYTSPIVSSVLPPLMSSNTFPNRTVYGYMKCKVGKENMTRHIEHFKSYPDAKKYVIVSHPENLTDEVLWEYAKEGIRVKIMGYQAQPYHFDVKMKKQFDKHWYCPSCGYKLNPQGACDQCDYSLKEEEKETERLEDLMREAGDMETTEGWNLWDDNSPQVIPMEPKELQEHQAKKKRIRARNHQV
ncbi:MAG: hypothetical protein V1850_03810 [Candidatus Bathyarchaeota archaeon]